MRDLYSEDSIREWAFEEAETMFSHMNEGPPKEKLIYKFALQLIEDAQGDIDIDRFDDGV